MGETGCASFRSTFHPWQRIGFTENSGIALADLHLKHKKKKILGSWVFGKPIFQPMDHEIIRNILVRDFNHFHDTYGSFRNREVYSDAKPVLWFNLIFDTPTSLYAIQRNSFDSFLLRLISKVAPIQYTTTTIGASRHTSFPKA